MVQKTRRVVEDYVLYKLRSVFPIKKSIQDQALYLNHENGQDIIHASPLSQPVPSRLCLSVRNMAKQYEDIYKQVFLSWLEEIGTTDLSSEDVDHIFSKITQELFQFPLKQSFVSRTSIQNPKVETVLQDKCANIENSQIKWGHLVALLIFAGLFAVKAVECHSLEVVDHIISWVTNFLDTELSQWLTQQGGWDNFTKWSKASETRIDYTNDVEYDANDCGTGIKSVMRVGVIAACVGLGALMLSKK